MNTGGCLLTEILEASRAGDTTDQGQPALPLQEDAAAPPAPKALRAAVRGKGVTSAVASLLAENPGGLPATAIVETLKDSITTESPDRSRLIRNTILNMRRRGAVVESGGIYRLASNGTPASAGLVNIDDI
jgi:hypothetical protein